VDRTYLFNFPAVQRGGLKIGAMSQGRPEERCRGGGGGGGRRERRGGAAMGPRSGYVEIKQEGGVSADGDTDWSIRLHTSLVKKSAQDCGGKATRGSA